MALLLNGMTVCGICGKPIHDEDCVAFPAFLPEAHPLWKYSDGVFHAACFGEDPLRESVQKVYAEWRAIWDSRPRNLRTDEEREAWAKAAFANFSKADPQ